MLGAVYGGAIVGQKWTENAALRSSCAQSDGAGDMSKWTNWELSDRKYSLQRGLFSNPIFYCLNQPPTSLTGLYLITFSPGFEPLECIAALIPSRQVYVLVVFHLPVSSLCVFLVSQVITALYLWVRGQSAQFWSSSLPSTPHFAPIPFFQWKLLIILTVRPFLWSSTKCPSLWAWFILVNHLIVSATLTSLLPHTTPFTSAQ